MSTILSMPTSEPLIVDTPAHLPKADDAIEWLAITPNEPHLLESLSTALAGRPAAILKVAARTSGFVNEELQSAIDRCMQQREINQVVLVGSSPSLEFDDECETTAEQTDASQSEPIYDRLLAGARSQNAINREAQESFVADVNQFLDSPAVKHRWSSGTLAVCGLFYRSCDGVLLLYDPDSRKFKPLTSH